MNHGGKTGKQNFGDWGERVAIEFLKQKEYIIVNRNIRFRVGEIDIIAWNKKPHFGRTLCFIEVKTRSKLMDSGLWLTTQQRKMESMQKAARLYCIKYGINMEKTPIQFEYVAVKPVFNKGIARVYHKIITIS